MNLIVFASFIIFVLWLTVNLKKTEKTNQQIEEEFWERETKANSVRKKSLDHLPLILMRFQLPTPFRKAVPRFRKVWKFYKISVTRRC